MLKPPGRNRLTLKCDVLLSNFVFKFNLRRYTAVVLAVKAEPSGGARAGAYARSDFSST